MITKDRSLKSISDKRELPVNSLIIQVGPYPPPYGGISVRIKRLSGLINAAGTKCVVFSPKQRANHPNMLSFVDCTKVILRNMWFRWRQTLLVHIQHSEMQTFRMKWYFFISLIRLGGGKVVVSLGSLQHDLRKVSFCKTFWFKHVTKLVNQYIGVGPHIAEKLIEGGCPKEKVCIIPGFVPPDEEELVEGDSISEELNGFLEKHRPIVMANASGVVSQKGRDLYGLDMCLELTARLRNNYPNLGFVYAIAPGGHGSIDNWDYVEKIRKISRDHKVEHNFYIRIASQPLAPLLRRCDVFVRPTCTDGDANSVREALYFGKPVAASDAVWRPDGCLTFRDGDTDDFTKKVDMILNNLEFYQQRIAQLSTAFPHHDLLRLYAEILTS
jgi:glycosyltransferase involved in cell wall biosynthesis